MYTDDVSSESRVIREAAVKFSTRNPLPFDPVFPRKAAATATRKGLEIRCAPGVINIHVHAVLTVQ